MTPRPAASPYSPSSTSRCSFQSVARSFQRGVPVTGRPSSCQRMARTSLRETPEGVLLEELLHIPALRLPPSLPSPLQSDKGDHPMEADAVASFQRTKAGAFDTAARRAPSLALRKISRIAAFPRSGHLPGPSWLYRCISLREVLKTPCRVFPRTCGRPRSRVCPRAEPVDE